MTLFFLKRFAFKFSDTLVSFNLDVGMCLLHKGHVTVVDGAEFGSPNNICISFATSMDNLIEAIKRIQFAMDKLV